MPVQDLINKLVTVGEEYPKKSNAMLEKFMIWNKHDNQPAANQLISLREHMNLNVSEKLQEIQLIEALVGILNSKDFVSSTKLMTGIKTVLSSDESFKALDVYLPKNSDLSCPKIEDLRSALTNYWNLLLRQHETDLVLKRDRQKMPG